MQVDAARQCIRNGCLCVISRIDIVNEQHNMYKYSQIKISWSRFVRLIRQRRSCIRAEARLTQIN